MTGYILLTSLVTLGIGFFAFFRLSTQFGGTATPINKVREKMPNHYNDGRFINLQTTDMRLSDASSFSTMKEFFFGGNDRVPAAQLPINKVSALDLASNQDDEMRITWLGHSSVLIQIDGTSILTDPMFGKRASPLPFGGPARFSSQLPLSPDDVPHLDAIVISHDHYDHLDYKSIRQLHERTDHFFVPLGVSAHLKRWGVDPQKIIELDWWEGAKLGERVELTAAPARHFSGRGLNDRNKTLWASWIIKGANERIYFSGDSGYGDHFKEIGDKYGPFDLAFLECGAYNEAWALVHLMPEQTAQAFQDLNAKILLPIHWAQFNLSLHPWREPIERLSKAMDETGGALTTPQIGEKFVLGGSSPNTAWWKNLKQ